MLELHDCIYCGQPLVINKTSGKVFNISCGHFEQEVMFYVPLFEGGGGAETAPQPVAGHHYTPTAWATTAAEVVEEEAPVPVNTIDFW